MNKPQILPYSMMREEIVDGDLLLFSGTGLIDTIIKDVTNSDYSHVGMCFWWGDRLMVLESIYTYGVRCVPLSWYAKNWENRGIPCPGTLWVARYDRLTPTDANTIKSWATNYLGRPYNQDEIAAIAFSLAFGVGATKEANALICSEYVALCFAAASINFPKTGDGFWYPASIAAAPGVNLIYKLDVSLP